MRIHPSKVFLFLSVAMLLVILFALFPVRSEKKSEEFAPSFSLPSVGSGQMVKLSDLKGKIVLVNFWATWCAPCLSEMPAFQEIYERYRDQGLEVVAISVDEPENLSKIKKVVADFGLSFSVLHDTDSEVFYEYGVLGVPETFFIDKQGKLLELYDFQDETKVSRFIGDRDWLDPTYLSQIDSLF